MKNKSKGVGKRRTGGGRTKGKANKQAARSGFETRHIDQVAAGYLIFTRASES